MSLLNVFEEDLQNSIEVAFASMEGKYGGMQEVITLLILVLVFNFFIRTILKKLQTKFTKANRLWHASFVAALDQPLTYFIWFIAATHGFDMINRRVSSDVLITNMNTLIGAGAIIALSWFFLSWKKYAVAILITRSNRHEIAMDQGKIDIIGKLFTVAIIFFSLLLLLEFTERSLNTLIAFGGVGGIALAFASQEVIANFFGGILIYSTHPFSIGDEISMKGDGVEGHVEEIGWYMTRVRNSEKKPIYVPNSLFTKGVVTNSSRLSHRHFKHTIGIRYEDLPKISKITGEIRQMLEAHPQVEHSQKNEVNFVNFGQYSLDLRIKCYIPPINSCDYYATSEDLLLKIGEIIAANGAAIPISTETFTEKLLAK